MTVGLLPVAVGLIVALVGAAVSAARRRDGAAVVECRLDPVRADVAAVVPAWFVVALRRCEITVDPARAWPVVGAALLVGAVALGITRPALAVVAVVVLLVALGVSGRRSRRGVRGADDQDLERLIDALVADLAAGRSLAQAIDGVGSALGPVGSELRRQRARHRGSPVQTVLDAWAAQQPNPGPELVADALALAGSSGGSQVRALQGVGETLREHRALDREVRALGSQAQASATVLVVTPVIFAVLVGVVDRDIGRFMVATPAGWVCLTAGLLLDLAGGWWMRRLTAVSR